VPPLTIIVEHLARAQSELLRAADAVPTGHWKTSPGHGRWTAGDVVGHLITIERAVLAGADKLVQKPPMPVPFFKRWHVPMALVESRILRRKTPIPLDAGIVREKEEMLAELREVRERTLSFIEENRQRDLSKYYMPHAFLGTLSAYEWLQLIASHEVRHTKQMRGIATALPKIVANLQK
jgi:uncharacterized damage-inducible protein DinB